MAIALPASALIPIAFPMAAITPGPPLGGAPQTGNGLHNCEVPGGNKDKSRMSQRSTSASYELCQTCQSASGHYSPPAKLSVWLTKTQPLPVPWYQPRKSRLTATDLAPCRSLGLIVFKNMSSRVADAVFSTLAAFGAEKLVGNSAWRTQRLLVLCWHGISNEDEHLWRPGLYITPQLFHRRLEILAELGCSVLSLDDALARLWAGNLPPRSVVITFDDGFNDFATKAVPILKEFGFPATLYLTTYHVDDQHPLYNLTVSYLLWKSAGTGRRLADGTPIGNHVEAELAAQTMVRDAITEDLSTLEKDNRARELAGFLGQDYDELCRRRMLCLMTADQVKNASASGIAIEAHTHRHRTPDDLDLMTRELRDNITRIQQITGRRPVHFCYPSGVFNANYFPLLEQEGFRSATTCEHALATRKGHRYMIPRWLDKQKHAESHYRGWLSGLRPLVERSPGVLTMRYWTTSRPVRPQASIQLRPPEKDYRG